MELANIDWIIIVAFFALSLGISLKYRASSGKDMKSFFLGGGKLPWYLAGISMVATTFAADTPLAVTEIVKNDGISGNWLWWNFLAGGLLTTFFFAKLWKRSGVLTEAELIELRYSGKPARALRGIKAVYLGLFMNVMIIGWVNVALVSILSVFFGLDHFDACLYTIGAMIFVSIYSSIGGLKGIIVTDSIQFILAMIGSLVLAYFVIHNDAISGLDNLKAQLPEGSLNFLPTVSSDASDSLSLSPLSMLVYMGMMWWACWYPGAEPGGGGYIAQRMMSTKDENHAFWATLFFQIGHYVIRPWPWIITALACIILYPEVSDENFKLAYVYAIKDHLPVGIKGLLLTSFFAAYMSTISTQLNWGTSYLVNDLYKRFIKTKESEKHYVNMAQLFTFGLIIISGVLTFYIESISAVWKFLMSCGAGLGLVLILRWYWQKINAWGEIVAMIAPAFCTIVFQFIEVEYEVGFIMTVAITTISWIITVNVTAPTATSIINQFIDKVQPTGKWKTDSYQPDNSKLKYLVIAWLLSIIGVYAMLMGIGSMLFDSIQNGSLLLLLAGIVFFIIARMNKQKSLFTV